MPDVLVAHSVFMPYEKPSWRKFVYTLHTIINYNKYLFYYS